MAWGRRRQPRDEVAGVLLGGRWEPFTGVIYFVRAAHPDVVADVRRWKDELGNRYTASEHTGRVDELLDLLEPACVGSWKALWVETASEWTAVFSQGSDLSYVAHFGLRLATTVMRTSHSPHVVRDSRVVSYGDTALWITDGSRSDLGPLRQVRAIQASHQDAGWTWQLDGEQQPFEDPSLYQRPRTRDRFDLDTLNAYCAALGIRRDDPAFYGPRATLIEDDTST